MINNRALFADRPLTRQLHHLTPINQPIYYLYAATTHTTHTHTHTTTKTASVLCTSDPSSSNHPSSPNHSTPITFLDPCTRVPPLTMSQPDGAFSFIVEPVEMEVPLQGKDTPPKRVVDTTKIEVKTDLPRELVTAIRRAVFEAVPTMRVEALIIDHEDTNVVLLELRDNVRSLHITVDPTVFDDDKGFEPQNGVRDGSVRFHRIKRSPRQRDTASMDDQVHPNTARWRTRSKTLASHTCGILAPRWCSSLSCTFDPLTTTTLHPVVFAGDAVWHPQGDQRERLPRTALPQPLLGGVNAHRLPITHLSPGQRVHCWLFASKGKGAEHDKWRGANAWARRMDVGTNHNDEDDHHEWHVLTVHALDGLSPHYHLATALDSLYALFAQMKQDCAPQRNPLLAG